MKCPRCGCALCTVEYEGAEVETCPDCKGEWLDAEELKHIVNTVEQEFTEDEIAALDAVNTSFFSVDDSLENQLKCPKCKGAELNRFTYAATTGITLDKCKRCGGIWLDDSEIEKVQMLVEEWRKKLQEDMDSYGAVLRKLEARSAAHEDAQIKHSRLHLVGDFINSVLRYVVD